MRLFYRWRHVIVARLTYNGRRHTVGQNHNLPHLRHFQPDIDIFLGPESESTRNVIKNCGAERSGNTLLNRFLDLANSLSFKWSANSVGYWRRRILGECLDLVSFFVSFSLSFLLRFLFQRHTWFFSRSISKTLEA